MSADQEPEYEHAIDGLTDEEARVLREEAQTPWISATVAHLKFQALVAERLKGKNQRNA